MSSSQNSSSSSDPASLYPGLHDVICQVEVVLGTGKMTVRECLQLQRLSVISLKQQAGEDLQVVVNGVLIASGEVVIVDDSTSIRVTEILPPPSAEAQKG
jgi:flagellar motor switch protein FliN/FliY